MCEKKIMRSFGSSGFCGTFGSSGCYWYFGSSGSFVSFDCSEHTVMLKDWALKAYSNRLYEGGQTNTQKYTVVYIGRLEKNLEAIEKKGYGEESREMRNAR